jgi:DNA-dependent RNA polymerase auxiliary subunit epsilon
MQTVELVSGAKILKSAAGTEYKFEPVPNDPTREVCVIHRHNMTVTISKLLNVQPVQYRVFYQTKLQKSPRGQGTFNLFSNVIKCVEKLFNSQHKAACRKVEDRERNKLDGQEFLTKLKVGTILVSSWGYSMTIVDFYKVKQIKGNKITLIELNNEYPNNDNGSLSGSRVVAGNRECGEPKDYMIRGGHSLKISSSQYAHIWDGKPQYENRND